MKKQNKYNINEKQYFNAYEFDKTKQLGDIFGLDAKKDYEEYFLRYPKDYTSYPYYASFLIKNRELDEAEKVLDYGFVLANKDGKFRCNKEKFLFLEKCYVLYKLKILFYRGQYQGVLDLYDDQYNIMCDYIDPDNAFILYCKKRLGILNYDVAREDIKSYLYRQIIEYKEDDFREHIKKHLANDAINMDNASPSIFVPDFPVDKIIEEIKKYIPSDNCIYPGGFEDVYIFKYNECGRDRYCMTDYFKVFSFHDTKDIITISPSVMKEVVFPCIDLNYLKKRGIYNIRKKTQVEKFYNKYSGM